MHDGSRQFADIPQLVSYDRLREHAAMLKGAVEKAFVTDHITEMWLEFDYEGHCFSVNDQMGEYWFFVNDRKCPDDILLAVLKHFQELIET